MSCTNPSAELFLQRMDPDALSSGAFVHVSSVSQIIVLAPTTSLEMR